MKVKSCVIPAAGLGSRCLPMSYLYPKELLPLGEHPILWHALTEAKEAGIEHIVIVTSKEKRDFFSKMVKNPKVSSLGKSIRPNLAEKLYSLFLDLEIETVIQKTPKGLGDAVYCAHNAIRSELFAVSLPDVWTSCNALKALTAKCCSAVSLAKVPLEQTQKYGIVGIKNGTIYQMVEKPQTQNAPSNLAIIGRYVLHQEVFDFLKNPPTTYGEIQLTDALSQLCKNQSVLPVIFDKPYFDCGSLAGLHQANQFFYAT